MRTTLTSALLVARRFAVALGFALSASEAFSGVPPSAPGPDFELPTMTGPKLRLHEQRGKVVLVNFWATWCGPCRQEMPHLDRLYRKYHSAGFVLLGISVDDDRGKAAEFARKLGVSFPVLFDTDKAVSGLYGAVMPSTLIIDRDGKVRYVHLGYLPGYEVTYEQQIRELMK